MGEGSFRLVSARPSASAGVGFSGSTLGPAQHQDAVGRQQLRMKALMQAQALHDERQLWQQKGSGRKVGSVHCPCSAALKTAHAHACLAARSRHSLLGMSMLHPTTAAKQLLELLSCPLPGKWGDPVQDYSREPLDIKYTSLGCSKYPGYEGPHQRSGRCASARPGRCQTGEPNGSPTQ